MIRKVHRLLAALSVVFLASFARAQLGIYGTVSVQRMSGIVGSPVTTPGVAYNDTVDPLGGTGGIYYDFKNFGPVRLGGDVRGSIVTTHRGGLADSNGAGARINSGLGGVRASFRTPLPYLKPYLEAAVGIGRSNYGVLTGNTGVELRNNFEYHLYGGLDLKLFPIMDFRVAEFGYGGLDAFGTGTHNYPLKSVSTGVVFHLPSLP
jgi:hypothetical protein